MEIQALRGVRPYPLVNCHRRFGESRFLLLQGQAIQITVLAWLRQGENFIHFAQSAVAYCATSRKVAGSILDGVIGIFH